MASFKKVIRDSWVGRHYNAMEGKENRAYTGTPGPATRRSLGSGLSNKNTDMESENRPRLRRNTSATQSFRDIVGSVRQKLKKSTRQRKRLQDGMNSPATPRGRKSLGKRTPTRRGGYREVKMYSPFSIESPLNPRVPFGRPARMKWFDMETPTKLRKEVEDLTANIQALVSLTPDTLMTRAASRRSLQAATQVTKDAEKTPRSNRKVKVVSRRTNIKSQSEVITEL